MGWARSLALLAVVAGLTACGGGGRDARLPALLSLGAELLGSVPVGPPPGAADVTPTAVTVKNAPSYVVATGSVALPREAARSAVDAGLRRSGFAVSTDTADTLVATRDATVAEFTLYDRLGELRAAPGTCLVQLRLADRDPRLVWTQV